MITLGLDVGGTKIELLALDAGGAELLRRRVSSPQHDYAATLACITDLVRDTEDRLGALDGIGIATPGAIAPTTGLLRNSNSTWLNGRPLLDDLVERLGRLVRIENEIENKLIGPLSATHPR